MINNDNKKEKKNRNLKIVRFVFFIFLIFIASGISVVVWDKYVFPRLRADSFFKKFSFVKKGTESTMVINKTEQVTVSEEQDISKFTGKSAASVVEIVSKKKSGKETASIGGKAEKIGSGLIVTADGLVVTFSDALLSKDAQFKIFTSDGKSFGGRLVFSDPYSGISFLKIDDASNLPVAEFISPQDIKVGSKIIVIGKNGFGVESSFRLGILSENNKVFSAGGTIASSEKLQGVFMIDANLDYSGKENLSGGAVADYNGNIVGILGMRKEDQENRYFVISADIVQSILSRFIEKGNAERGSLGVYYKLLSKESAFSGENELDRGAMVYSPSGQQGLAVIAGSAAEKAGIRVGDVILNVNGEEVNPSQNLAQLIAKYRTGDTVDLKIMRDGKEMEVKAVLQ